MQPQSDDYPKVFALAKGASLLTVFVFGWLVAVVGIIYGTARLVLWLAE